MGLCASSAKKQEVFGFIRLQLEKIEFFPGEELRGNLYLNLVKPFPGSCISLNFEGQEFCQWAKKETEDVAENSRLKQMGPVGKKSIFSKNIQIYNFPEGNAPAGQYNFPISFSLDQKLPSTYSFVSSTINASICYNIIGCLNSSNHAKIPNLLFVQRLTIFQPDLKNYGDPSRSMNIEGKSLWFFSRGHTKLNASLNKNNFIENENCHITCTIDNKDCNLEVESMEINVVRALQFQSNRGLEFRKIFILEKIQRKVFLPAKYEKMMAYDFDVQLRNKNQETHFTTSLGSIVKNFFFVQVSLSHHSIGKAGKPQRLIIPFLIHKAQPQNYYSYNEVNQFNGFSQVQEQWEPQEMPQQKVSFVEEKAEGFDYPIFNEEELMDDVQRQMMNEKQ